jgi:hypothetical protein
MKRITLLLVSMVLGSALMAQSFVPDYDLQKMQQERESQIVLPSMDRAPFSHQTLPYTQPTRPNVILSDVGYAWNAYDAASGIGEGAVSITIPGGVATNILPVPSATIWMAGGDFGGDTWWTVNYDPSNSGLYTVDHETKGYNLIGLTGYSMTGLAYDVTTGVLYASAFDGVANSNLYTVNTETGAATLVGTITDGIIIGIAACADGNLFGTHLDTDALWSIDKATGAGTQIGPLGVTINYAQDIGFDRDNGILYGTLYTTAGGFYEINTSTGAATLLNNFVAELCALGIPYTLAEDDAPGAATDLAIAPGAMGALNAEISWNNPATTVAGEPLTELTAVMLYRDGEVIQTWNNPVIGGAVSYTDNVPAGGNYTYAVYGENSAGMGLGVNATAYIGPDVPAAPGDVMLVAQGNDGFVTWTAPTEGLNGGYFTGEGVTYDVVRFPGAVSVATGLTVLEFLDATVPGAGNYYYEVTASNAVGVGGTAASNVALLGAEGLVFFETFNEPIGGIPAGWQVIGMGEANWSIGNSSNAGGTAPELVLSWSPSFVGDSWLATHASNAGDNTALRLKINHFLSNFAAGSHELKIGISTDSGATWTEIWNFVCSSGFPAQLLEVYFSVPANTDFHVGFGFSGDSYDINNWNIDNLIVEPVLANDLAAGPISGNTTPSVGVETMYTVVVQNAGAALVPGSAYNVQLFEQDKGLISEVPGVDIEPAASASFELPATFDTEGATVIYGYVSYPDDDVPNNNQTANLNLVVQPGDIIVVTIGTGTNYPPQRMPFDFFWKNSLRQTLYLASEIGLPAGALTQIEYTNNFSTDLPGKDVNIWIGETALGDLSGGYIDPATLTLVYSGPVDFLSGENSILIALQTPYIYTGGNLVVYSHRVWEDQYFSSLDRFYGTDLGGTRTIGHQADGTVYDPAAPPASPFLSPWVPNISMYFSPSVDLGGLEGTVTSGGAPVEGVDVHILGTVFTAETNAAGFYEFPTLLAGEYDVEFSKYGYETLVAPAVVVSEQTTVLDVSLTAVNLPEIVVAPESLSEVLPVGGMSEHEVTISNLGDLPLNWSASLQYPDFAMAYPPDQGKNRSMVEVERDPNAVPINIDPTDDLYDLLFQFPVGVGGGEYAVATDGNFIYTAAWNSANFYKYQMDGVYLESFTIAGAGNCRDLTYDGQYFYAAPNTTTIYQMDFTNQTLVGTITAPAAVRGIAYDADNDGFWVTNGWDPPIRLISRTGTVLETLNTTASSFSGLGWENVLDGAPNLWAYTQPASNNILVKIDIATGATLETFDVATSVTFDGGISGGMVITDQVFPGKWAFLGTAQNDVIWALDLTDAGTPWVSIAPRTGSVPGGESDVMIVSFNAEEVEPGTYHADIVINSNDPDNPTVVVPVTLVVGDDPILLGDANCDGQVNVQDVIWTIQYILGNNPQPFCFENADVNGDGFVNTIDVIGIVNLILNKKASVPLNSAAANIYLNRDNITLQSDGTLAGLQFEISGQVELDFVLPGYQFASNLVDGKLTGIIFTLDNTPLPAGEVTLFNFNETAGLKWGNVIGGNYNAEEVAVNKFMGDVVLNVFPNPAKDRLNVQANQVIDFVRLTNQLGQVVEETILQVESAVINTSHLRKGIYILEVHTAGDVSIQKIVIE